MERLYGLEKARHEIEAEIITTEKKLEEMYPELDPWKNRKEPMTEWRLKINQPKEIQDYISTRAKEEDQIWAESYRQQNP